MLGDDLMSDEVPLTKQLINEYEKTHSSILAVKKVHMMKSQLMALLILKAKLTRACITLASSLKNQLLKMRQVI